MGKFFSNLTKPDTAVEQPSGDVSLYKTPQAATMAASGQIPSVESMTGGSVLNPTFNAPALPKVTTPSYHETQGQPGLRTTKGNVLSMLLGGGLGYAAGYGSRPGEGQAKVANLLFNINEEQQRQQNEALDRQLKQAEIQMLPLKFAAAGEQLAGERAKNALTKAQTDSYDTVSVPTGSPLMPFVSVPRRSMGAVAAKQIGETTKANADPLLAAYNKSVMDVIAKGEDPAKDPGTLQLASAIQARKGGQMKPQDRYISNQARLAMGEQLPTEEAAFNKGYEKNNELTKIEPGVARMRELINNRFFASVGPDGQPLWASGPMINSAGGSITPAQYSPEALAAVAAGKNLAPTKVGDQVNSYNQLTMHLGSMMDLVGNLKNTNTPWVNEPINKLKLKASGNPDIARFLTAIEAPRKEYESFLLNNRALYEDDRKEGQKMLNENMSPNQIFSSGKQMLHTAAQRMAATNAGYKRVSGGDIPDLVMPEALDVMNKYGNKNDIPKAGAGKSKAGEKKPTHRWNPATQKIEAINAGQ